MLINKAVIVIAGDETAMKSNLPRALHEVCGKPALMWTLERAAAVAQSVVIAAEDVSPYREYLVDRAEYMELSGEITADAREYVLLLSGVMPLVSEQSMTELIEAAKCAVAAYLVMDDGDGGMTPYQDVCCVRGDMLTPGALKDVSAFIDTLKTRGERVLASGVKRYEGTRIVDRASLWEAEFMAQAYINARHMKNGVTMIDPHRTYIGADVTVGRDTILYPNTMLTGNTTVGEDCKIYDSRLIDTVVGDGCELKNVVAERACVGNGVKIGPFVNLRPDTVIADGCKIGDFVEVKNSNIGSGTKLPHLSYIGDADVGERVNVGCGCVFVNYDGIDKHRTTVGSDVFLGCQTNLVAPVSVGDGAYTAAGSTITENVPDDALAIARARQENKPGWVKKYYALRGRKK